MGDLTFIHSCIYRAWLRFIYGLLERRKEDTREGKALHCMQGHFCWYLTADCWCIFLWFYWRVSFGFCQKLSSSKCIHLFRCVASLAVTKKRSTKFSDLNWKWLRASIIEGWRTPLARTIAWKTREQDIKCEKGVQGNTETHSSETPARGDILSLEVRGKEAKVWNS